MNIDLSLKMVTSAPDMRSEAARLLLTQNSLVADDTFLSTTFISGAGCGDGDGETSLGLHRRGNSVSTNGLLSTVNVSVRLVHCTYSHLKWL